LEKDYDNLQKGSATLSFTPANSSNKGGSSKLRFANTKNLKSDDDIGFSGKRPKNLDRFQIFLYLKGSKGSSKGSSCPYIDIKNE